MLHRQRQPTWVRARRLERRAIGSAGRKLEGQRLDRHARRLEVVDLLPLALLRGREQHDGLARRVGSETQTDASVRLDARAHARRDRLEIDDGERVIGEELLSVLPLAAKVGIGLFRDGIDGGMRAGERSVFDLLAGPVEDGEVVLWPIGRVRSCVMLVDLASGAGVPDARHLRGSVEAVSVAAQDVGSDRETELGRVEGAGGLVREVDGVGTGSAGEPARLEVHERVCAGQLMRGREPSHCPVTSRTVSGWTRRRWSASCC